MKPTALLSLIFGGLLATSTAASNVESHTDWDGSRTVPVHRLPLFDEEAQRILPTMRDAMPLSTRWTCGTCHDYDTIRDGFHFNGDDPQARSGRAGEPWFWVDRLSGTALPVSTRDWPGVWSPGQLGLTAWEFTKLFGRHMPGGGLADPSADEMLNDPEARWDVSGGAQINCLACHDLSPALDMGEWSRQMERENFRWATTAASGLGLVGGMAARLDETWNIHSGPDPDDQAYAVPPSVHYEAGKFDPKYRTVFEISGPIDRNCLYCHSTAEVDLPRWQQPMDVHSAAGISCAQCHHNDLSHDIVRGYEGEAAERGDPSVARFTCAGCHLGQGEDAPLTLQGGTYAAPHPAHKGIPPIHFEKMSCTACHSGALPTESGLARMRTSRANRLGIHGRAQWFTNAPVIVETAFVRDADTGKIESRRLAWPSFWTRIEGEALNPIRPDAMTDVVTGILDHEAQASRVLTGFAQTPDLAGTPVLGIDGQWYALNRDGGLDVTDAVSTATTAGVAWAVAENGKIHPFVPAFDPKEDPIDYDAEGALLNVLSALERTEGAGGEAVLIYGGKTFRRDETGMIVTGDAPGSPSMTMSWGWLAGETVMPLIPQFVADAVKATVGSEQTMTEQQVAMVLRQLKENEPAGAFGYVSSGVLLTAGEGDALTAQEHAGAGPLTWPLGHGVRPAAQSLGVKGCTDCHGERSSFFFAEVTGQGPLQFDRAAVLPMHQLEQVDDGFQKLFGQAFTLRETFKTIGFAASFLLAGVMLFFLLAGLGRLARWLGGER